MAKRDPETFYEPWSRFNIKLTVGALRVYHGEGVIPSAVVPEGLNSRRKWLFNVRPKCGDDNDHIGMSLVLHKDSQVAAGRVKFEFIIQDGSGKEIVRKNTNASVTISRDQGWGLPDCIKRDRLFRLVDIGEGSLRFLCKVEVFRETPGKYAPLSKDLGKLYNMEEFADAELNCAGRTFYVSRYVLSARSDAFKAMFTKKEPNVEIKNVDPDVMENVLKFIYTGDCRFFGKNQICETFKAAERYGLTRLMELCEEELMQRLSRENAAEFLTLAIKYSMKKFHDDLVVRIEEWKPRDLASIIQVQAASAANTRPMIQQKEEKVAYKMAEKDLKPRVLPSFSFIPILKPSFRIGEGNIQEKKTEKIEENLAKEPEEKPAEKVNVNKEEKIKENLEEIVEEDLEQTLAENANVRMWKKIEEKIKDDVEEIKDFGVKDDEEAAADPETSTIELLKRLNLQTSLTEDFYGYRN